MPIRQVIVYSLKQKNIKMKKLFNLSAIALFLSMFFITSCNKDVTVFYNVGELSGCLPQTNIQSANGYEYTEEVLVSDIRAAFDAAKVTYDLGRVKTARFKNFKAVVSTTGANFDQIAGMQLYVKADGTSGAGEQIAYVDNIGSGVAEVALTLNGVDIKSLMNNQKLILTLKVFNKSAGNDAICVKITSGIIEIQAKS